MANFWSSFVNMVQVLLLDYIKSIRMGNWYLHLQAAERMLPWYHAYAHTNYSLHFIYNWALQKTIEVKHPDIHHKFQNGNFSIKRSTGSFNMMPPDEIIEQAINKEQKGAGGITGVSTSHIFASISADFNENLGLENCKIVPKEMGKFTLLMKN